MHRNRVIVAPSGNYGSIAEVIMRKAGNQKVSDSDNRNLVEFWEQIYDIDISSIVYFEIRTMSSSYNLGHDVDDPMTGIRARYQQEPEISFAGGEEGILKDFSDYLLAKDPDISFVQTNILKAAQSLHTYLPG